VKHLSKGHYQITFGGPPSSGTHGTVKVSAFGSVAGDCAASGWHGASTGVVVDVHCYTASGAAANREFTVTYAGRSNLMGLSSIYPTVNALVGATGRVQTQYDSVHRAHVTVSHATRGWYKVQMNGTTERFGRGDVQVSPITSGTGRCVIVKWTGGPHTRVVATVHCFDRHGSSVNSAFAIQFVIAFLT
jgi:hypothetical protein